MFQYTSLHLHKHVSVPDKHLAHLLRAILLQQRQKIFFNKINNVSTSIDTFYSTFTAFLACTVYLCYSPSAVNEELESQPVCCPVVCM